MKPDDLGRLFLLARSGDHQASEALYLHLKRRLLPAIHRINPSEAEDVFQEVVLRVLTMLSAKKLDSLPGECFLPYIWRMALRLAFQTRRRGRCVALRGGEQASHSIATEDPSATDLERSDEVKSILASLTAPDARLAEWLLLDQIDDDDARERLGLSGVAYRQRKCRLFQKIRDRATGRKGAKQKNGKTGNLLSRPTFRASL